MDSRGFSCLDKILFEGPEVYYLYSKPVSHIVRLKGLTYHIYADDSQLYLVIRQDDDLGAVTFRIENCVSDVQRWMSTNLSKLNESKAEIIFFSCRSKQDIMNNISFKFGDSACYKGFSECRTAQLA